VLTYLHAWLIARLRDERGASAVEYGLLVAGVAAAMIFSLELLGAGLRVVFERTNSQIECTSC
jgi:pilus assembly protein Flp/PilA